MTVIGVTGVLLFIFYIARIVADPPTSPYHLSPCPQDWRKPDWPEVSVSVVTWNQRQLIGRALDSILAQKTTFSYEIVVGDDASNDGTREILLAYQRKYPELIRLFLYRRKLPGTPGRLNNMLNPLSCRGKYTALLDGDDYWTDCNKLQSQYEVMESHPTLSCAFHDTLCELVDPDGKRAQTPSRRSGPEGERRRTGFYPHEAFCADRNIKVHTSSLFFRTRVFGDFPDDYEHVVSADHYLFLLITQRGPIFYDNRVRSVYEQQPQSLTISKHYLSTPRLLQQVADTRMYQRRFPATNLTPSYSTYALKTLRIIVGRSLKERDYPLMWRCIFLAVREWRGAVALLLRFYKDVLAK